MLLHIFCNLRGIVVHRFKHISIKNNDVSTLPVPRVNLIPAAMMTCINVVIRPGFVLIPVKYTALVVLFGEILIL